MTIVGPSASTQSRPPAATNSRAVKVLHAVRHGITEMNVYLSKHRYYEGMKDPKLWDTRLTPEGMAGARNASGVAATLNPKPEVLIVSPLSRALHTAELVFPHYEGPTHVEPLARERVWLSSDCGSSPRVLDGLFGSGGSGRFSFDHLPDVWWYAPRGEARPDKIPMEPEAAFRQRVAEFKAYLLKRPEAVVAVVAHWGLLHELTGHSFDNCEIKSFELHDNGISPLN
uniref:Uncharacterized protein n=1 Tax=Chlamydomonas euryale TaxID=1486919 RepID=A0A7R9VRV2_9CHLO